MNPTTLDDVARVARVLADAVEDCPEATLAMQFAPAPRGARVEIAGVPVPFQSVKVSDSMGSILEAMSIVTQNGRNYIALPADLVPDVVRMEFERGGRSGEIVQQAVPDPDDDWGQRYARWEIEQEPAQYTAVPTRDWIRYRMADGSWRYAYNPNSWAG